MDSYQAQPAARSPREEIEVQIRSLREELRRVEERIQHAASGGVPDGAANGTPPNGAPRPIH